MSRLLEYFIENKMYAISDFEQLDVLPRDNSKSKFLRHHTGLILQSDVSHADSNFSQNEYLVNSKSVFNRSIDIQDQIDTDRRFLQFGNLCVNKTVVDFGCGFASFLKKIKGIAANVYGVELSEEQRRINIDSGVQTYGDIESIGVDPDIIFFFHSFHYLLDPVEIMRNIIKNRSGARGLKIIIEVPSANDLLLNFDSFLKFTLHKELIVLHTEDSLKMMLNTFGFSNIRVSKYQRYGLDNHINWMVNRLPGGHLGAAMLPDQFLYDSVYKNYLYQKNYFDTLITEIDCD